MSLCVDLKAGLDHEVYKHDAVKWVNEYSLLRDKAGNRCELDYAQRQIFDPKNKRVILNCHRQYGKSTISSLLCLHTAIYSPRSLCLLVSPSLRQSSENFRKVLDALSLGDRPELEEDTKLSLKLSNGSRIVALPGSQRTIRGFSAPDTIVIDEDGQAEDELFEGVYPMLTSNPSGRMILASTPWLPSGHFHKIWTEGVGWLKIKIDCYENPRLSAETIAEAKLQLSPQAFARDYLCQFIEPEEQIFSSELFKSLSNLNIAALKI